MYDFDDRHDAGRRLAAALAHLAPAAPVVLALPRGGVPVAAEVAAALGAPLALLLVRKIGAPLNPEVGIGALVDGNPPQVVIDEDFARRTGAGAAYLQAETAAQRRELERRRAVYGADPPEVAGRTVIVVDDGVATGNTLRAALRALAAAGAARRVIAVPVGPPDVIERLAAEADETVCLAQPAGFAAVGYHYRDFAQLEDAAVLAELRRAAGQADDAPPSS